MRPVVGIVAALPEEASPLRSRLLGARRLSLGLPLALHGQLAGHSTALVVTGDGERSARQGIEALLERMTLERLLVIGVSGALTSDLGPGALVVAESVRGAAGSFHADADQVRAAVRRCGARPARMITSAQIADSPAERARLLRVFSDAPTPAAVDLESAVFVEAAVGRRIPWLVLRSISDTAVEHLPSLLNRSRGEDGGIRRGNLLRGLLLEPATLPTLLSLRWRVGRCAQVLAAAVERLLTAETETGSAA
jgi:nucleoside phosphorylase